MTKLVAIVHVDVDSLANAVADVIAMRIEPMLAARQRRLVDRPTMAGFANVKTAKLNRLVAAKQVPSVLVGGRRLFDSDKVIDSLAESGAANNVYAL